MSHKKLHSLKEKLCGRKKQDTTQVPQTKKVSPKKIEIPKVDEKDIFEKFNTLLLSYERFLYETDTAGHKIVKEDHELFIEELKKLNKSRNIFLTDLLNTGDNKLIAEYENKLEKEDIKVCERVMSAETEELNVSNHPIFAHTFKKHAEAFEKKGASGQMHLFKTSISVNEMKEFFEKIAKAEEGIDFNALCKKVGNKKVMKENPFENIPAKENLTINTKLFSIESFKFNERNIDCLFYADAPKQYEILCNEYKELKKKGKPSSEEIKNYIIQCYKFTDNILGRSVYWHSNDPYGIKGAESYSNEYVTKYEVMERLKTEKGDEQGKKMYINLLKMNEKLSLMMESLLI